MYFDIDAYRCCFNTNPNEAYFWHGETHGCGGQNNAKDIATENNGKTLEMCMLENRDELEKAGVRFKDNDDGTVSIDYGNTRDESKQFWEDCSKSFAEQSSGNVYVIEGSDLRPTGQSEKDFPSVYNRIEYPALEQNQQVDSITKIDPASKKEIGHETFDSHSKPSQTDCKSGGGTNNSVAAENGGGARTPNGEAGNTAIKPTERGTKPSKEGNTPSKKEFSSERGQKPSSTEDKSQSKGAERGQKPAESEIKPQDNNYTPRGEKPQEAPQNTSSASQTQRGTPPGSAGGEDSKTPTSSSSNPSDKVPASSNSAKAADEASNAASEQAAQNVAPKATGMSV